MINMDIKPPPPTVIQRRGERIVGFAGYPVLRVLEGFSVFVFLPG